MEMDERENVELADRMERIRRLEGEMGSVTTQLAEHRSGLDVALVGVSNFKIFQLDMKWKVGFVYGVAWVVSGITIFMGVILGWVLTMVVPAAKVIMDDYYARHPAAVQKTGGNAPPEAYTRVKPAQDATTHSTPRN